MIIEDVRHLAGFFNSTLETLVHEADELLLDIQSTELTYGITLFLLLFWNHIIPTVVLDMFLFLISQVWL